MSQPGLPTSKPGDRNRDLAVVAILLSSGLALLLYRPTLNLPLLYDDLLHIRIVGELNFLSVWLPTEAFGFFRPLTFLPLLIIERLFESFPPALLHGLNVAQHALNVALLSWLSWRLWNRWHWSLVSGLVFALYPFSYQAVSVYGHNVHPAVTGLLLIALHTYLKAIRAEMPGRRAWWIITAFLFLLGLLSHESAILFGAFAALVHFNENGLPDIRGRGLTALVRQPWFMFLLAGALYLVVYQFFPLSRAPQATFASSALSAKALYILQSAAYPLTWFSRFLADDLNTLLVLAGFILLLALSYWSAKDVENRLPLLMGWGWWALASLLVALPLSASYLLHGPRLLYLASAGFALLLAVLLEPLYRLKPLGRLLWWVFLIFILVSSWLFVRGRLESYTHLTSPVGVIQSVMEDRPAEEGILLINLPQFLAPPDNTYPIGVEFVAMLGDYLFAEELLANNLGVDRPVKTAQISDLLSSQDYQYALHGSEQNGQIHADWAADGSHIFITTYTAEGPQTDYRGILRPASGQQPAQVQIGPYDLLNTEVTLCENEILITTAWSLTNTGDDAFQAQPTTSLFVQLLDHEGQLIDQEDGPPIGLRPDLLELPPNWQIVDRRVMSTKGQSVGQILLGVYDFTTGQRIPPSAATDLSLFDDAIHLTPRPLPSGSAACP